MVKRRKATPSANRQRVEIKEEKTSCSGDEVAVARDRLKGVLQGLINRSDESGESSNEDASALSTPGKSKIKSEPGTVSSAAPSTTAASPRRGVRVARKRRRRDTVRDQAYHHTYVMKLFDRSVDLAQFAEDTPLYPVCRAWMANQPRNTNLVPKSRTPTPEPQPLAEDEGEGEGLEQEVKDIYHMPPPQPWPNSTDGSCYDPRIPPSLPIQQTEGDLGLEIDQKVSPTKEALLREHQARWAEVRKRWKVATWKNEARFAKSRATLQDMFVRSIAYS